MRIIVSGATGFVGGQVCGALRAAGHHVVGLGRNMEAGRRLAELDIEFLPVDIAAPLGREVTAKLGPADAFVHAAALSSAWGPRQAFHAANVEGTRRCLALAREIGASRFVFLSSPSVTFRFADQPGVREDEPFPAPVNAYAASKQQAETLVLAAPDLSPIMLRPRAIYGQGDTALLPRLIRAARRGPLPLLRGGQARTNLTHVDDVVAAIAAALAAGPMAAGRVFNIAGPQDLALRDIVERAAQAADVTVRWQAMPWPLALAMARTAEALAWLRPGRPEPAITAFGLGTLAFTHTLDTSAAMATLQFEPSIGFEEGLKRTFPGKRRP